MPLRINVLTRRRRRCCDFLLMTVVESSMSLVAESKPGAQILLDWDTLQDRSGLFSSVSTRVRTLVVLCSQRLCIDIDTMLV